MDFFKCFAISVITCAIIWAAIIGIVWVLV